MQIQEIIDIVRGFEGSLVITPEPGGPHPELSWGDAYFYYAPDGRIPERTQPYATIITKNYPDDTASDLDRPGRFRVNIHVGAAGAAELGRLGTDPAEPDAFVAHPLYGTAGWVSVVNPGAHTGETVASLLRDAHAAAQARCPSESLMGPSPQTLSEADRRILAAWAADCAERVLPLFEADAADDDRPREAIGRARVFALGELSTAGEIRRRFEAGPAAHSASHPAAVAAARAATQAAAVAHMGAHALGAAAYAARAVKLAHPGGPDTVSQELRWQHDRLSPEARAALSRLPLLGAHPGGPLGNGLLASSDLAPYIRAHQTWLVDPPRP